VRFFIDECISPSLSRHLSASGLHDAIHPRDRGRLRETDHVVFARAIAEDRIVVTENADDFRKLAARVDLHPGLIILPSVARSEAQRLMDLAIDHLTGLNPARPQDAAVNSVLTVTATGDVHMEPFPRQRPLRDDKS
jgi:predicted nuclease of predicted toxin-antitoxin system